MLSLRLIKKQNKFQKSNLNTEIEFESKGTTNDNTCKGLESFEMTN